MLAFYLVSTALFVSLGILFASGKGLDLITRYRRASWVDKERMDKKKLLKAMSVFMFVFAGCFLISALSQLFHVNVLIWIGQALFIVALITGSIYLKTGDRFRK